MHHPRTNVLTDPQLRANQLLFRTEHPWAPYPLRQPRAAARFVGAEWELRRHAPLLGEHTREVLEEVGGLAEAEISALFDAGVARTVEGKVPERRKIDARLTAPLSG